MTGDPKTFAYWLQGFVELCGDRPTEKQWEMIKEHLQLVFVKVTGDSDSPLLLPSVSGGNYEGAPFPPQIYCAQFTAVEDPVSRDLPAKDLTAGDSSLRLYSTDHTC